MMLYLLIVSLFTFVIGRECDSSDFIYEYTSCGERGERWRVAIPRSFPLQCTANTPPPQKGLNCSFTCGKGNYVDIESQSCRQCNPGTYSLGGGVRFDEFARLPSGFTVENIDASQDLVLDQSTAGPITCSDEAGWIVRNTELLYIPSPCVSKLSFSANLVRPGYVEYSYRMPTNSRGISMNVVVKNEQCQSYRDEVRNLLSGMTTMHKEERENNGDWQKKRMELRTGPNVISWTVTNSREMGVASQPIVMVRIDIVGIAFTRQCTACPAGSFSGPAAAECKPCEAGFFSTKGSAECASCPLSQYSGPKSAHCYDRPACKQNDFYPITDPCVNGKTRRTYKKVAPAVCNENVHGAAKLPSPEPERDCPKCNPGMGLSPNGICEFCPEGSWSDGNICSHCPGNTLPSYGYNYIWWHSMPPHLEGKCEFVSDDSLTSCSIGEVWLPNGDSIVTAPTLQRGIAFELILTIDDGFHNPLIPSGIPPSSQNPVSSITIVFDTRCIDDSCAFYFIEDVMPGSDHSFYRFLGAYNGSQPRRVITHQVVRSTKSRYMLAFIRSGAASGDDSISDQARIFSINVTNIGKSMGKQGGGAASCIPCALGAGGCFACDNGKYLDEQTRSCTMCPPGTFSNVSSSRLGVSSCIPCGPNVESDGTQCFSSGKIKIDKGDNTTREYDMTAIANKTFTMSGVRVFAREGTSYFHTFNMTILGKGRVECKQTIDTTEYKNDAFPSIMESVDGSVCRLTAIPVLLLNHTQSLGYVSPLLIATSLAAITEEREFKGWKITDASIGYDPSVSHPLDVHFFFNGPHISPSDHCPNGTAFVLTARCDPNEKKVEFKLPPSCPDGTCDGCLYQSILESSIACPLCSTHDYQTIKGECINAKQTIHSIPQKHCVLTGSEASERVVPCSILSSNVKVLIVLGCTVLIILLIVLCAVFRRNQRLEYKYMKLVESKGGYELAGAESCALEEEEEEEEEDRVIFSKSRKQKGQGGGLFGRLTGRSASQPQEGDRIQFAAIEHDED